MFVNTTVNTIKQKFPNNFTIFSMADGSVITPAMDISKLKVPDLKKELKNRGLSTSGNKTELVERLQMAMKSNEQVSNESVDDLDEDLLNEDDDDVHLETTESVIRDIDTALNDSIEPKTTKRKSDQLTGENGDGKPPPKKVILNRNTPVITESRPSTESRESNGKSSEEGDAKKVIKLSEISAKERLEMRAKKFDVPLGVKAKKVARAERFGLGSKSDNSGIKTPVNTSLDVLKKRAERFGGSVSKVVSNVDAQERLEKRKARFGIVTAEDKAKQRLERFKPPVK